MENKNLDSAQNHVKLNIFVQSLNFKINNDSSHYIILANKRMQDKIIYTI